MRFVPILVGLVGISTGNGTDKMKAAHSDSTPPCRVIVKQ